MSDIRTAFEAGAGDWLLVQPQMAEDDGLETAVVLSLFTDALAGTGDALPSPTDDRRGWWGDAYAEQPGDRIGSRLWLLGRERQLPEVLARAEAYAMEALRWLVTDGVARSVTVTATVVRSGVLGLEVEIARSLQPVTRFKFEHFWKGA